MRGPKLQAEQILNQMVQEANLVPPTSSVAVEHMLADWLRFDEA